MWWHSQVKHTQMAFEGRRIHTALSEGFLQVFPAMQTLAAGGDFNAMKQQIETLCRSVRSSRCRIKWPPTERKSNDKTCAASGLLLGNCAQLPFPFRIEVIRQVVCSSEVLLQKLKATAEFPYWHVEHRRK